MNGVLVDYHKDMHPDSMKTKYIVALEDHMFLNDLGKYVSLPEKGLSQQQATQQAHQKFRNMYDSKVFEGQQRGSGCSVSNKN